MILGRDRDEEIKRLTKRVAVVEKQQREIIGMLAGLAERTGDAVNGLSKQSRAAFDLSSSVLDTQREVVAILRDMTTLGTIPSGLDRKLKATHTFPQNGLASSFGAFVGSLLKAFS